MVWLKHVYVCVTLKCLVPIFTYGVDVYFCCWIQDSEILAVLFNLTVSLSIFVFLVRPQ